ncbi:hypothetical protein JYU34_001363 [Plutella xylostella]|uniref:Uncharacterized protein n=1 Tax=Plutella xylostella TaxID=51655 RepID=A0ABQ7R3U8_PLUXY|nr:hypothetical protein JYU34_001363 [Plutella xylostella]
MDWPPPIVKDFALKRVRHASAAALRGIFSISDMFGNCDYFIEQEYAIRSRPTVQAATCYNASKLCAETNAQSDSAQWATLRPQWATAGLQEGFVEITAADKRISRQQPAVRANVVRRSCSQHNN